MELQNGYTIMYNAADKAAEKHLYAAKGLPASSDVALIAYNNGASVIDCKSFKLIYSDGEHLLGSLTGLPSDEDVNIVIKSGDEIVFGKVQEVAAQVKAKVVAPKKVKVEEQKIEEPVVEEIQVAEEPVGEEEK